MVSRVKKIVCIGMETQGDGGARCETFVQIKETIMQIQGKSKQL